MSGTTTYWLVKPASTMAAEYTCGIEEHVHTDECYADVLICGYGETEEDSEDSEEAPDTEEAPGTEAPETEVPIEEAAPEAPAEETEEPAPVEEESTLEIEEPQETEEPQEEEQAPVEAEAAAEPEESADEEPAAAEDPAEEPVTEAPAEEEAEPAAVSQEPDESEEAASEPEEAAEDSEPAAEAHETDEGSEDSDSSESASKKSSGGASKMAVRVSAEPAEADEAEESEDAAPAEDGEHVHTAACYEKVLVCGKEEHIHDETCSEMLEAEELGELICTQPEHTHTEDCWTENGALICTLEEHTHSDSCYKIEQGDLMMVLPAGAEIPEGYEIEYSYIDPDNRFGVMVYAPEEAIPEGAVLKAELLMEDSDAYAEAGAALEAMASRDELVYDEFVALDIHFLLNGEEVQPEHPVYVCINALGLFSECADLESIAVQHHARAKDGAEKLEEGEEEIQVVDEVAEEVTEETVEPETAQEETTEVPEVEGIVVETVADSTEETGPVEVTENEDTVDVAAAFNVDGFSTFTLTARINDPVFKVQHYAYVQKVSYSDSKGTLDVIDTSGGALPKNGDLDLAVKKITIKDDGTVKTSNKLEMVYTTEDYTYSDKLSSGNTQAENLKAINKLDENTNYTLSAIWVRQDGVDATDTDETDWTVYDPSAVNFVNQGSEDANTVVLTSDTVIRLVYKTSSGNYKNATTMYDYDITDGKYYKNREDSSVYAKQSNLSESTTIFAKTNISGKAQGINSPSNYSGSGTKLAFGNENTATGLGHLTWKNNGVTNMVNGYNDDSDNDLVSYAGCTFKLVKGLQDGKIVYSSNINAPKLFNEGSAKGKTAFTDATMTFERNGDTYTLTSIKGSSSGVSVSNLHQFTLNDGTTPSGRSYSIWSNNFWPMDGVAEDGHDIRFGTSTEYNNRYFYGVITDGTTALTKNSPQSDDMKEHNSYFGMNYAVRFDLTADYVGPLDYLFFGDDDMWVFLTDLSTGKSTLVCDIGGVHSSVGEYVNLWDYMTKEGRTEDKQYTLSFFYTERGASGSSCYMRFTLPSVSSVSPDLSTGDLVISKDVVGATGDAGEFEFTLTLLTSSGAALTDQFPATHSENGACTVKSGDTIRLGDDDKITITGLPAGTKYSITEAEAGGYHTTYRINSGTVTVGNTASGSIVLGTTTVAYVNTTGPMLPSTGGPGTNFITTLGTVMMLGAGVLLLDQRRRKGGLSAT